MNGVSGLVAPLSCLYQRLPGREAWPGRQNSMMPGTSQGLVVAIYYFQAVSFHFAFLTAPQIYWGSKISPTVCSLGERTRSFLPHSLIQNRGRRGYKVNFSLSGVFSSDFGLGWVTQGWRTGRGHSPYQEGWHTVLMEFLCEPGASLSAFWFSGTLPGTWFSKLGFQ